MANTIQIKRSPTNSPAIAAGVLNFGELAFSQAANIVWIGQADGTPVPIGGAGNFAPLNSPAFTGTPTAPTATLGNDTTQIATTGFVTNAITYLSNGTVHSVSLSLPSIFNVTVPTVNGTVPNGDGTGTLTATLAVESAGLVFAGPGSGVATAPTFRALVATDIPSLSASIITSGVLPSIYGGTGYGTGMYHVGDILYASDSNTLTVLPATKDTTKLFLTSTGNGTSGAAPAWLALTADDIPTIEADQIEGVPNGVIKGAGGVFESASPDNGSGGGDYVPPFQSKSAHFTFIAPVVGGYPTWRILDPTDIPNLDASKITSGLLALARGGTGVDLSLSGGAHTFLRQDANHIISADTIDPADLPTLDQILPPVGPVDMNGWTITGLGTPINPNDATNKNYVDSARAGLDVKESARVATTGPLPTHSDAGTNGIMTSSSPGAFPAIDGVTLNVGDRILVKDETNQTDNGIYVLTSTGGATDWVLTRSSDANTNTNVVSGMFTYVSEGTTNATSNWVLTTIEPITLGTTNLIFSQFSGAGQITPGDGLSKTGNTLNVVGTANRITSVLNYIDIASTYVGQASIITLGAVTTGTWNADIVNPVYGGTGLGVVHKGDLLFGTADTTPVWAELPVGLQGQFLKVDPAGSGLPVWSDLVDGGIF